MSQSQSDSTKRGDKTVLIGLAFILAAALLTAGGFLLGRAVAPDPLASSGGVRDATVLGRLAVVDDAGLGLSFSYVGFIASPRSVDQDGDADVYPVAADEPAWVSFGFINNGKRAVTFVNPSRGSQILDGSSSILSLDYYVLPRSDTGEFVAVGERFLTQPDARTEIAGSSVTVEPGGAFSVVVIADGVDSPDTKGANLLISEVVAQVRDGDVAKDVSLAIPKPTEFQVAS